LIRECGPSRKMISDLLIGQTIGALSKCLIDAIAKMTT